jgi:competence protein ComFA
MKAFVYAKISDQGSSWHTTLDIRADLAYWLDGCLHPLKIWMLEPAISFGQAVVLTERLNHIKWEAGQVSEPSLLLARISRQAEQLGISLDGRDRAGPEKHGGKSDKHSGTLGKGSGELGLSAHLRECDRQQWESYRAMDAGYRVVDLEELGQFISIMQGRSLFLEEVSQLLEHQGLVDVGKQPLLYIQMGYLRGELQVNQGVHMEYRRTFPTFRSQTAYKCHRCGSGTEHMEITDCLFCGASCPYCVKCLTMGRSRYCSVMVSATRSERMDSIAVSHVGDEQAYMTTEAEPEELGDLVDRYMVPWGLSAVQAEASYSALQFLKANEFQIKQDRSMPYQKESNPQNSNTGNDKDESRPFLIWAVTGAGKTEMIFPMIQYMLRRGKQVVVATPRRDVVLELQPRLKKAFAPTPVVTLYGGSEQRWDTGVLTIATTHQLLRFERAFDLVIIDELDAFPFHNNPMLEYAAHKVCTNGGVTLLLSATPPKHLQKAAKRDQLAHVKVPARYHRHPLPVPIIMPSPSLPQQNKRASLHRPLRDKLDASLQRGAQLFIFVPKIHLIESLVSLLRRCFPSIVVEGTSSKDEQRAQKVIDFRQTRIRILVTTTILERGVTIAKSDVFILDADSELFDSASLVQMAGRAGRSADDPSGHVFFVAKERTRGQIEAVRQIKSMNALAKKKGYLRVKGDEKP